jgi:hypothetical protein
MSATVTAALGNPDPSSNPTNLQDLVTLLNSLFLAEPVSGGPFTPYVISSTTPSVSDQDKAWLQTDGNGRPLAIKLFYNGGWRKFYKGNTSEVRIFRGDPTIYFDNTGLGLSTAPEPNWDGWAILNGNNGTENWSDTFPIFGRMDNVSISGYSSGWQTNVTGGATKTGGAALYQIKNTDLPSMKVFVSGKRYSSGAGNTPTRVLVDGDYAASGGPYTDPNAIASFGSDPSGTPPVPQTTIPTLPPYRACCACTWVGYS